MDGEICRKVVVNEPFQSTDAEAPPERYGVSAGMHYASRRVDRITVRQ